MLFHTLLFCHLSENGEEFNDEHIKRVKEMLTDMFPENINVVYFDIYTLKNNEVVEVYRPVLHRKDFEISTIWMSKL
ncbi:MAG: hypothetical protein RR201_03370 [Malacoplasma sp.]